MSIHPMPPNLDEELRNAFRRMDPPAGFTDRVMARIPQERPARIWRREWLAIAASTLLAVVGAGAWQQHQRQIAGEKAKQELIYALTVASQSLEVTKQMITR